MTVTYYTWTGYMCIWLGASNINSETHVFTVKSWLECEGELNVKVSYIGSWQQETTENSHGCIVVFYDHGPFVVARDLLQSHLFLHYELLMPRHAHRWSDVCVASIICHVVSQFFPWRQREAHVEPPFASWQRRKLFSKDTVPLLKAHLHRSNVVPTQCDATRGQCECSAESTV